jgi:hypothetical protein
MEKLGQKQLARLEFNCKPSRGSRAVNTLG